MMTKLHVYAGPDHEQAAQKPEALEKILGKVLKGGKYHGKQILRNRQKKSIARVYLVPGTGNITINKRDIDEYLGLETLKVVVRQPFSNRDR